MPLFSLNALRLVNGDFGRRWCRRVKAFNHGFRNIKIAFGMGAIGLAVDNRRARIGGGANIHFQGDFTQERQAKAFGFGFSAAMTKDMLFIPA